MKSITHNSNKKVYGKSPFIKQNYLQSLIDTNVYGLILLLSFFLFWNSQARATHVVGGAITYVQMENNNYLLTVKLYRDCTPGTAQLPGNVNVQCRRGFDGSVPPGYSSHVLPLISSTQLSPQVPACSFDPGICVQEAIYQEIVNIPPAVGGYHLYFTICCRNGTIQNITTPLNAQETFYAYIPYNNSLQSGMNSSPFFNGVPPVYVCAGQPLDLSFQATDPDGDSLDYYFYTPFDGQNNGGITYGPGLPPNNINISPVNWQPGFGATDPLDAAAGLLPGLTIDNNGFITGVPPAPGQYVVGVMVDEYRNGVLIGRVSRDFQFNVINCPPPLDAIADIVTNCDGLNIDFLNMSTGNPTTHWWDFGTGNPADSSVVFQPSFAFSTPGTYPVTLIINKGTACADTTSFNVTVMNPIAFNVIADSVSCNGVGDGQAVASANDLTYVYDWSTLQTGSSIQNLNPGNYWVQAINTIGCFDTNFFVISEPAVLQVQFNSIEPLCAGDTTGSIDAIVSGGTTPYSYYWPSQNFNGNPLQNVGNGYYTLQITDDNGCYLAQQTFLDEPSYLSAVIVALSNVSCYGANDGMVTVMINGGTPGYAIDWLTLPNDSTFMDNLAPGNYIAEVTDANNCLTIVNAPITQPDSFYVDIVVINDETCTAANAEAFADITGGIGVISYLWTPTGQTTDLATGLMAGPIQVTVQDQNGCQAQDATILIDHPTGTAHIGSTTPVSCQNGSDGTIEILMNGGTAPYDYSWSCACPNQNILNNLSAGNYWVAVTDSNGCVDSLNFTINELPPLQVQATVLISPSCYGGADGQIEAEAIGGTQPYGYSWNTLPVQTDSLAIGLAAGTYTVTVTDDNGCTEQMSAQLVDPAQLIADAVVLGNIICFGDSSGIAQAQGIGGTSPYSYLWIETGDTTAISSGLLAGTYNVVVTDYNGCQAFNSVGIVEYDDVYVDIVYDSLFCPGDVVDFSVLTNGMNNQYDFNWFVDHVLEGTNSTFSFQIFDTSNVTISLVNIGNCPSIIDSTTVGPIMMAPNNVSAFATPDTICFGSPTSLQATINDMSNITSTYWNVSQLIGLGPHVVIPQGDFDYIITIENVCGEQQSDTARVNVFMPPAANIFAEGISGCERVEVDFSYTYNQNYIYGFEGAYWNIYGEQYNEMSPQITFNSSLNVDASLYIAFSNGCIFEYDTLIGMTVFPRPEADFYYNPDPALEGELTEFIDVTYGNTQDWEWYVEGQFLSTDERPSYIFDEAGEYTVTEIIFDENGCSDTVDHIVEVIGSYTVFVPNAFTPQGNGVNETFKPIVTDVDPDQYRFQIYNRWGEMVYETEVIDNAWNGTYLGENVNDGVYIWKVMVTDNVGIEHEYVGHVTLLR